MKRRGSMTNTFPSGSGLGAARARGRSSTLQRAGTFHVDPPSTPPGAASATGSASVNHTYSAPLPRPGGGDYQAGGSLPSDATPVPVTTVPVVEPLEEPCGLTPASLKHLRRQRDSLVEDKSRLQTDLTSLKSQLSTLQAQVEEQRQRISELEEALSQSRAREEEQRERAAELQKENRELLASLSQKERECARLAQALADQQQLTKEVCEAAERRKVAPAAPVPAVDKSRERELEMISMKLQREKEALARELEQQMQKHADMQINVAAAMAAAEKAMAMHAQWEQLRAAKLADAINSKVALHISVPRVTLSYNNAPPLLISTATGLSKDKIRQILDIEIFPHFEPLWVRLDDIDQAPDGTSKKNYATKMLERLTDAVKLFVVKSQEADAPPGTDPSIFEDDDGGSTAASRGGLSGGEFESSFGSSSKGALSPGAASGAASRNSAVLGAKVGAGAPGGVPGSGLRGGTGNAVRGGGGGGGGGGGNDLGDADRERLLELLRLGDDKGLDTKLCELLAKSKGGR